MEDGPTVACRAGGAAGATRRRVGVRDVDVCPACGFGAVVTGDAGADYWARKHDAAGELASDYWAARLPVYLRALDEVTGERGPGRVLDIGGGGAHFAEAALARGWDAYSSDVSEHAVRAAAARLGTERSLRSLPDAMAATCDVVTLWCVVAHVEDAADLLAEARRALKPEGLLLLSTPNFLFQAVYAALSGRLGRPLDFVAQDHISHYTPRAIEILLTTAGFRPTQVYWGVSDVCLLEERLGAVLVPAKRVWNRAALGLNRLGLPRWSSELHVRATLA